MLTGLEFKLLKLRNTYECIRKCMLYVKKTKQNNALTFPILAFFRNLH